MTPCPKPPKPERSEAFKSWVRSLPCLLCGSWGSTIPHHHGGHGEKGAGRKVSDFRCVPLCGRCHRQYHDARLNAESLAKISRAADGQVLGQFVRLRLGHGLTGAILSWTNGAGWSELRDLIVDHFPEQIDTDKPTWKRPSRARKTKVKIGCRKPGSRAGAKRKIGEGR